MVKEEIVVKSKDYGEFKYTLEQPESLAESVTTFGEKESLDWLLAGRKAEINSQEWQKIKGTKTEEVEAGGKKFRIPKELAAVVRAALAKQEAAA
jgi:hypothetical protein